MKETNPHAVALGKKSADSRRMKHGDSFNDHMRALSQKAVQARIDKKKEKISI